MADDELALKEGEALNDAPIDGEGEGALNAEDNETPEPIANLARDLGWTPKDEWAGDPDKWKPAEQFIRDGRDIQQSTSRELKAMRDQLDRLGNVTTTIVADREAQINAQWEARLAQATEDGDTALAVKLAKERPVTQPQGQGADPSVAQWVAKNPWYSADPLAAARAQEISDRLKHLPVDEQLRQVERAIRKEYPEHFPKAKDPPATQTGQQRNAAPTNRQKGFADIPQASQAVFFDMAKRHSGLTKEAFATSYWQDQEGVRR